MPVTINSQLENGYFGENSFIITDVKTGESAVVDPCFENFSFDIFPDNVKYVLLTHGHIDHIAQTKEIYDKFSAQIVSHKDEKIILESTTLNLSNMFGFNLKITPDILLSEGDNLKLGESIITVLHTPGHTQGSCCYIVDNHMFTGDTVISKTVGRCDFATGSFEEMKNSIAKIKSLSVNYNIYCGHGNNTNLDYERKNNPYFR